LRDLFYHKKEIIANLIQAQSSKRKRQNYNLKRKAKPFFYSFELYALRFEFKNNFAF